MSAGAVDDPLEQATATLDAAIETVMAQLSGGSDAADKSHLAALADTVESGVAPAIGGFLGALFDQVVAYEKSTSKRAKEVDGQALSKIDAIARQINFIAVNAAVEAARVGAAGRGFAIIAAEIKSLSEQSQKAVEGIRAEMQ